MNYCSTAFQIILGWVWLLVQVSFDNNANNAHMDGCSWGWRLDFTTLFPLLNRPCLLYVIVKPHGHIALETKLPSADDIEGQAEKEKRISNFLAMLDSSKFGLHLGLHNINKKSHIYPENPMQLTQTMATPVTTSVYTKCDDKL